MTSNTAQTVSEIDNAACPKCRKRTGLCVCDVIQPAPTKLRVLFLQHPQEPDKDLGSAWIAHKSLTNSTFRIGLSWPNLSKALGEVVDPKRWAVLYLGSATCRSGLTYVTAKGTPLTDDRIPKKLDGLVVLDGTWSQAKTLWWRNAWLLKLNRIVLTPQKRSLYGRLRKEPRKESLSTIESVSQALELLGEPQTLQSTLLAPFQTLLERFQADRVSSRTY